jgi:hypothetical protein
MRWYGLDKYGSGQGPVEGSCEHGDQPSGSIKCWKVLQYLYNWQLRKNSPSQNFDDEVTGFLN